MERISKELFYEALKVVNICFDNNVSLLLNNKKKQKKIDLTKFKKELLKNNSLAIISDETLYEYARKLIIAGIRQGIVRPPF